MGINTLQKVYLLHHVKEFKDGSEDIKLLGVFSSKIKANETLNNHKKLPGFRGSLEGFSIDEYIVDKPEWNEGFGIK